MTEGQQKSLFKIAITLPKKAVIVELGVCRGKTALLLAYVASRLGFYYFGVDDFSLEGSEVEISKNMIKHNLEYNLLVGKTNEVAWDKQIDLLIVDAGHDPDNTKKDYSRWIPFVKAGGYVFMHDYEEPYNSQSPHWGVRYYGDQATVGWEDVGMSEYMKIKRRPKVLSDEVFFLEKGFV